LQEKKEVTFTIIVQVSEKGDLGRVNYNTLRLGVAFWF